VTTTTNIARIRRILTGHSERALVQAVAPEEFEFKLEVPVEAIRAAREGDVLVLTWSIHRLPPLEESEPSTTSATPADAGPVASPATAPNSSADEQFDALMRSRRSPASEPSPNSATAVASGENSSQIADVIARRLGLVIR
jgi:hypothetical protein